MMEAIKHMSAVDIFMLFDEEDKGLLSFNDFRKLLPFLGININDSKAYRYFRLCDTDGSGLIDIDEFKVALFTCDPTTGNPVGFMPTNFNTPLGKHHCRRLNVNHYFLFTQCCLKMPSKYLMRTNQVS